MPRSFETDLNTYIRAMYVGIRDQGGNVDYTLARLKDLKEQILRDLQRRGFDTKEKDSNQVPLSTKEQEIEDDEKQERLTITLSSMEDVLVQLGMNRTKAYSVAVTLMHQVIKEIHK